MKLTAKVIQEYQKKKTKIKTMGEYKELGRELRDNYNLSTQEALDILSDRNVLAILANHEE